MMIIRIVKFHACGFTREMAEATAADVGATLVGWDGESDPLCPEGWFEVSSKSVGVKLMKAFQQEDQSLDDLTVAEVPRHAKVTASA